MPSSSSPSRTAAATSRGLRPSRLANPSAPSAWKSACCDRCTTGSTGSPATAEKGDDKCRSSSWPSVSTSGTLPRYAIGTFRPTALKNAAHAGWDRRSDNRPSDVARGRLPVHDPVDRVAGAAGSAADGGPWQNCRVTAFAALVLYAAETEKPPTSTEPSGSPSSTSTTTKARFIRPPGWVTCTSPSIRRSRPVGLPPEAPAGVPSSASTWSRSSSWWTSWRGGLTSPERPRTDALGLSGRGRGPRRASGRDQPNRPLPPGKPVPIVTNDE